MYFTIWWDIVKFCWWGFWSWLGNICVNPYILLVISHQVWIGSDHSHWDGKSILHFYRSWSTVCPLTTTMRRLCIRYCVILLTLQGRWFCLILGRRSKDGNFCWLLSSHYHLCFRTPLFIYGFCPTLPGKVQVWFQAWDQQIFSRDKWAIQVASWRGWGRFLFLRVWRSNSWLKWRVLILLR